MSSKVTNNNTTVVKDETKTSSNNFKPKESLQSISELLEKVSCLEKQLEENEKVKAENVTLKAENVALKRDVKNLKRRVWRHENKIHTVRSHLQNSERKRKLEGVEKDKIIHKLETNLDAKKRKVKDVEKENMLVNDDNSRLKQDIFNRATVKEIQIKSGANNTYSDNVRQTVILLQSEAGVSSHNVSKVIKIIGKHIFEHEFKEQLPSSQTCLNMNAEGLIISNMQVAEKMLDSKSVTLHLDGTSRDHQKVVNHQVTLDDGSSLYLGFTLVATEDSNTILDVTISLLKKISECHSDVSKELVDEIFLNLLRKIKSTMTDRAATMKSFDKKLEEFLKSEVGEDFEINFLHCNAHFLLGMSDVSDKALKKIEEEIKQVTNEPIGRDKDQQFLRFSGENETCSNRLIRTLCDVLGPRGDQKNGCRVEWKEFCPDSKVPSFKSNRFNFCYFEAAAAIIHHYDKINTFFTSGVLPEKPNQKIQSVSQDIKDMNLISCICALGLFYLKVSGPYWHLVNSSTPYFQFCHHVRAMHSKFLEWSSSEAACESDLLTSESHNLFGSSFSLSNSTFSSSLYNFLESSNCNISIVKQSLQAISEACARVASRQLGNFLDGSFDPNDDSLTEALKNCPLTNLIGESSFGDLDYDIRKRANCSNLQRTASHCVKRNKTCSDFLDSKPKSKKALIFSSARRQRKHLVDDARSNRNEMSIKIKEKMVENQQKKIDREAVIIGRHGELMRRLEENGGICKDGNEVEELLEKLKSSKKSKKQITEMIKDQIRYHKLIRNVKDKDLNMTGSLEDIILRLKDFLNTNT